MAGRGQVRGLVVHQDRRIERVPVKIDYPNLVGTKDADGRDRAWQFTNELRVLANGRPYCLLATHTIEPVTLPGHTRYRQTFEQSSHAIRKRFAEITGGVLRQDSTKKLLMLSLAVGLAAVALILMVLLYITPDVIAKIKEMI